MIFLNKRLMAFNPLPNPANTVHFGHARFTLLSPRMIRLEWSEDRQFEDRPSFAAVHRWMPEVSHSIREDGSTLHLQTAGLKLTYQEDHRPFHRGNLSAEFTLNRKKAIWKFGQKDKGNLGGTYQTLDGIDGDQKKRWVTWDERDPQKPVLMQRGTNPTYVHQGETESIRLEPGLLSRDGWTVVDDSGSVVLEESGETFQAWPTARPAGQRLDVYLLAYGHDYGQALRDAQMVFGPQPVPPRYALGYWYSRYWAYTDREIEDLVGQFNTHQVPLDVMVIDMDWHKLGWTGYTWDEDFFPDYREFLAWLKKQDLKITLNLHPADGVFSFEKAFPDMCRAMKIKPGDLPRIEPLYDRLFKLLGLDPDKAKRIPLNICDPNYMKAYFECLHHPLERDGVDFWWMDWQQGNVGSQLPSLKTLPWINELHWQDQVRNRPTERPLNFSRYGGIGAGRMPVGFSGDTLVTWESLAYQPYFTATASNALYGYWSHDIGGHMGGIRSPELYARWLQFGLYSPILRTHTSKDPTSERRVFQYQDPYKSVMISALRQRYALMPYIYTEMRETEESGISLLHPLYYQHPEESEAYRSRDQFYFGRQMIVAPVVTPADPKNGLAKVKFWLPEGSWIDTATGEWLNGNQRYQRQYLLAETPVFVRPGAIWAEQTPPLRTRPGSYADLVFTIYPGGSGSFTLKEDDGHSLAYRKGEEAQITIHHTDRKGLHEVTLDPVEGDFPGFIPHRPVTFRFPASLPPREVKLNQKILPWSHRPQIGHWSFDGATATVVVCAGELDLRSGADLQLTAPQGVSPRLLDGFKGLMSRLEEIRVLNCLVSPPRPIIAEERLAVRIAQTGNRLSRYPTHLKAECHQLKKDLARLPEVLRQYEKEYRKKGPGGEANADHLARARQILRVITS